MLYKTNLCKFYLKGTCKRGHKCSWAHGETDIRPFPAFFKTRMCYNWIYFGTCDRQPCTYAHSHQELRGSGKALRLCNYYFRDAHCPKGARCPMAHDINQLDPAIKNLPPLLNEWSTEGPSNSGVPPQPPPLTHPAKSDSPDSSAFNYQARRLAASALPVHRNSKFPSQRTSAFHDKQSSDDRHEATFPAHSGNSAPPPVARGLAPNGVSGHQVPLRPLGFPSCTEGVSLEVPLPSEASHPGAVYGPAALSGGPDHAAPEAVLSEGDIDPGQDPAWSQSLFGGGSGRNQGDSYPPPAGYPFANSSSRSPGTVSTRRHPGENGIHLTRKPQQLLEGAFPQPLPPPPLDAAGSSRYLPGPLKNEAAQTAGLSAEAPQRPPGTFPCPVGPAQSLGSSASDCYRQNGTDVEPLRADAWLWRATEDHSAFRHEPSQISQSGWPGSALLGPPLKHIGPDNGFRCLGGRDSSTAAHDLSQQHRLYLHAGGDAEQSTSSRKASTAELYPSGADPFGDIWALLDDSPGPASSEPGCGGPGSGCAVTAQMKLEPSQAAPAGSEVLPEGEGPPCSKRAERPGTHVSREPLSESASERRQQPSQPFEGSCPAACSGNVGGEGLSQCADRAVDLDDPRVSRRDYLRGASLAPGARGTSSHRSVSGCPTVSSSVDCTAATRPNSDCRYFATSSISLGGGATNSSAAEGVPCSHSSSCNKGAVATVVDSYALVSSAGLRGLSPGRHLEPSLHIAKGKASAACVYSGGNDHDMQQARGREMQREVFPRALPCSGLWNGEQGFPTLAGDNSETGSAACCSPSHSNSSYNSSYSTSLGTSRNGSSDTAHNDCNRSSHSPPWGNIGGRSNEHPGAAVPSEESTDAELMRLTELFLHLSTSTSTCGSSAAAVADTDARQAQRPHEGAAAST